MIHITQNPADKTKAAAIFINRIFFRRFSSRYKAEPNFDLENSTTGGSVNDLALSTEYWKIFYAALKITEDVEAAWSCKRTNLLYIPYQTKDKSVHHP